MNTKFANDLPFGQYPALVVDPPWNQRKTGLRNVRPNQDTTLDYPTLSKQELMELPVPDWANQDSAFLWLWATNSKDQNSKEPILAMAFQLMEHWRFNYYTTVTWLKETGPCPLGPYQITTEHVLFGYRGKATFHRENLGKLQTHFYARPGIHSSKPNVFYRDIAKYFDGPRLDVFARQRREGFDGWGNEYGNLPTSPSRRPSTWTGSDITRQAPTQMELPPGQQHAAAWGTPTRPTNNPRRELRN